MKAAQKRVQLIMQYIHENYNRNLSLDEIASHIGISKSTALNLFHRFLHTTPVNYLIGYRLQAASWLLKNTNKKVKTIAYESGFHNVDYFADCLKTLSFNSIRISLYAFEKQYNPQIMQKFVK